MDVENLNAYQQLLSQVYSQGIQKNEESIKTWTQYKDRHKKIIEGLQTIVNDVSVNCMVPLGKRALMKGKLTHTNEILVCIGDGYFVKYSSQQAVELCNRRIKRAEETLKELEQEKNLLEARQMFPMNIGAFQSEECKDIIEHWDDKKIEDWRTEHRKKEKEYRQKLMELRNTEKKEIVTEEDLFKRLDELELEEELSDEINRLEGEYQTTSDQDQLSDETDDESSGDTTETEEEKQGKEAETLSEQSNDQTAAEPTADKNSTPESKSPESLPKTNENTAISDKQPESSPKTKDDTAVSEPPKIASPVIIDNKINGKFEVSIISEDQVERTLRSSITRSPSKSVSFEEEPSTPETSVEKAKSSSRRVSFAEPHFTEWQPPDDHHEEADQATNSNATNAGDEEEEDEEEDLIKIEFKHSDRLPSADKGKDGEILSPEDVYHMFSKPKSILKKNFEPYQHVRRVPLIDETSDEEYHIEVDDAVKSTYNMVVQDIKERKLGKRSTDSPTNDESTSRKRPVSRFKLERANLKNEKQS